MSKKPMADSLQAEEVEEVVADHTECEMKLAETEGKYKRALADYQNLERQTAESSMRFAKLATKDFVEQLVEPYDHLLLAAKHVKDKGLDMVITQFKHVFESQGLQEINPVGLPFDPQTMEAIDTKEGEEDKVVEVVSVGYALNGIVIKPAKVIVGTKSN
ncbi:MAG: nucleotide exchange factor GrpE [Candidatus Woesebacteria bacterium]